ncbi:hypothetical protein [Methanofollis fontis]|uniref:hypothetical protein n=1 Tax=Methanofollis fontis TaxID=2052832 RepID=UPI00102EEB1B|nr:hypothetical protein [Methanofollis fontis]
MRRLHNVLLGRVVLVLACTTPCAGRDDCPRGYEDDWSRAPVSCTPIQTVMVSATMHRTNPSPERRMQQGDLRLRRQGCR